MTTPRPPGLRRLRSLGWLAGSLLLSTLVVAALPQERIGGDFLCFWAAGKILASGGDPYDADLQLQVHREQGWVNRDADGIWPYDFLPFYYPPWVALAAAGLVQLGYSGAKVAWIVLNVEFLLGAGYLLGGRVAGVPRGLAVLVVSAFAFSVFAALMGQTPPLILFLAAAAWTLLERGRDRAAGGVLAWLTIKPQLTAVLLVGLLFWAARRGRWGVVTGFALVLGALVLATTPLVPAWPAEMWASARHYPMITETHPELGVTWLNLLQTFGVRGWGLRALYLAAAVPALAAVVRAACDRARPPGDVIAAGLLAAFFVAPYGRPYDFPVLMVPLFVLAGSRCPEGRRSALLMAAILPVVVQILLLEHLAGVGIMTILNRLGITFFWVPLLLGLAWSVASRRASAAPNSIPAPKPSLLGPDPLHA